jgi:hypothetical protein
VIDLREEQERKAIDCMVRCLDLWICGLVDVWICGLVDVWMCGLVDWCEFGMSLKGNRRNRRI